MKLTHLILFLTLTLAVHTKAENYASIDELGLRVTAPDGFVEASFYLPHTKVDTPANKFVAYFLKQEDLKQILSGGREIKDAFIKIDLLKASIKQKAKPKDIEEVSKALTSQYGKVFDRESPDIRQGLENALSGFRKGHGSDSKFTIKEVTFLGQFFKDDGLLSYLILQPTKYQISNKEFDVILVSSLSVVSIEGHILLVSVGRIYTSNDHISLIEDQTISFLRSIRKDYSAW